MHPEELERRRQLIQERHHQERILWDYRHHQENVLYDRMRVFLLAESLLFVAYGSVYNAANPQLAQSEPVGAIAFLGTVLTLLWWLAVRRQITVHEFSQGYVAARLAAYNDIRKQRKKSEADETGKGTFVDRVFSGQNLMWHSFPALIFGVWLLISWMWLKGQSNKFWPIALGITILLTVLLLGLRNDIKVRNMIFRRIEQFQIWARANRVVQRVNECLFKPVD